MHSRSARVRGAALALAIVARTPVPTPVPLSVQWKSTVTLEGAPPGSPLQEAQIWLVGGRMRIEERGKGKEKTYVLKAGGEIYVWTEGQPSGIKMNQGLALRSGRPWHEYVRLIAAIRSGGRKLGTEKVDGYVCNVFRYDDPLAGKGTYWLATKLDDFPVKAVVERSMALPYRAEANRTLKLEYHNTDIRLPASVSEASLAVPAGVKFQDVTELLLGGRPPRPTRR
jgi:hypothetical protein